jgi:hypothetical protein
LAGAQSQAIVDQAISRSSNRRIFPANNRRINLVLPFDERSDLIWHLDCSHL